MSAISDGYIEGMDGARKKTEADSGAVSPEPYSKRGAMPPESPDRIRLRKALWAKNNDQKIQWGVYSDAYGFIPYDSEELARYIAWDAQQSGHEVHAASRSIGPIMLAKKE